GVEDEPAHHLGGRLDGVEAAAQRPVGSCRMKGMRRLLASLLLALALPAAAHATGPWASFARPYHYPALAVEGDTVWCATLEAGLLQFRPGTGPPDSFAVWRREPGRLASNHVTSLALERSGRLWVGTDAGASRLSADRTQWDLTSTFSG